MHSQSETEMLSIWQTLLAAGLAEGINEAVSWNHDHGQVRTKRWGAERVLLAWLHFSTHLF